MRLKINDRIKKKIKFYQYSFIKKISGRVKIMYNRFVLNETSYHGAGAVKAVAEEITARGFKKLSSHPTPTSSSSAYRRKSQMF